MVNWPAIGLTLLPNTAGLLFGSLYRKDIDSWAKKLDKPCWNPPSWVFPPAWTYLYTSMGYASYLVLRDGAGESRKLALTLYGAQLALNWSWSPIYFGAHRIGLAAIVSGVMGVGIAATAYSFYPINQQAAYLMLPYLAWVTFATILNTNIWCRNRNIKSE